MRLAGLLVVVVLFALVKDSSQAQQQPHVNEENVVKNRLDQLIHDAAHTSDFIHQFFIPGWWWCTLFNFHQELYERSPNTLAFFNSVGAGRISAAEPSKAIPFAYNKPDLLGEAERTQTTRDVSIIKFMAFEFGLVSVRTPGMFSLSRENEGEIPIPTKGKFAKLFAVEQNQADDVTGMAEYTQSAGNVMRFLTGLRDKYCLVDTFSLANIPRYIPQPRPCMYPTFLSTLDRYSTGEDCADEDPSYMQGPYPTFVSSMVAWFVKHRHLHNEFQYHDEIHAMNFATMMPVYMELYKDKGLNLKKEYFMAAAMAGLFHDVGYFLIPKLNSIDHKEFDKSFDDAHELLSFITALWVYDKSDNKCRSCRRIIAVTILSTKINKKERAPTSLSQIQRFLDPNTELSKDMFFDQGPEVKQKDGNRIKTLMACAWKIYFDKREGMQDMEACKPIVTLLDAMDRTANVEYVKDDAKRVHRLKRVAMKERVLQRRKSMPELIPRKQLDESVHVHVQEPESDPSPYDPESSSDGIFGIF